MKLARIATIALLGIVIVSTVACGSTLEPVPIPSQTPTPTSVPTAELSQEEAAYDSVRDAIQEAVTAYIAEHMGFFPVQIGYIDGKSISIVFMARLIVEYHYLQEVPDGCYQAPGERDDNCDDFNAAFGVLGCSVYNHYIWGVDGDGAVYSRCVGNDCWSNTADGYQGVWP